MARAVQQFQKAVKENDQEYVDQLRSVDNLNFKAELIIAKLGADATPKDKMGWRDSKDPNKLNSKIAELYG